MLPLGRLSKRFTFSAAHYIKNEKLSEEENLRLFGKCTKMHGHNYVLIVHFIGKIDPETGIIVNLSLVKELVEPLLTRMDHSLVNDFLGSLATTEILAKYIYEELKGKFSNIEYLQVELWETENNCFIYPYLPSTELH
jgi:6-pyruvoyltetrahydropterin/6-carboxytetrahydropterin synthase